MADAVHRIGATQQRQHRLLHPRGQAGGGAAGGQHVVGPLRHRGGMRPLGVHHRRHVVGQLLAMHPARRGQQAIQPGVLRQPGGMGAQERRDERGLRLVGLRQRQRSSACGQAICWPVFAQSARKAARPLSVSGWLNSERSTAGGSVATWAPSLAASTTCIGLRTEATSTSVLNAG